MYDVIFNEYALFNLTILVHVFNFIPIYLCISGRYLFLTAIANQLRYPNSHTHYFSCTLLYLFAEANTEAIQEQITRYFLYYTFIITAYRVQS